jgi:hypothetical protein
LTTIATTVAEAAVAAAPLLLPIAGVVLAVAAIGIAIYEVWKHWDKIWGWIKGAVQTAVHFVKEHIDWVIAIAFGPFGIAINLIRKHWDDIWDAIKSTAGGLGHFFKSIFDGVVGVIQGSVNTVISVIDWMIRQINKFQIHIPSVFGLGGFDWNGLGLSELKPLSFGDGGIVPGPVGAPTLAVVHGGEEVLNVPQQRARAGSGTTINLTVTVNAQGATFTDRATRHALGREVADGVLAELHNMQNSGVNLQLTGRPQ